MKLKRIMLATALLVTVGANAQGLIPLQFGVKAGANLSNFSGDINDNSAKAGFNAGVTVDLGLPSNFYLASGLEFTTKGAKADYIDTDGDISYNVEQTVNAMYLQLPIHLGYKLPIMPGIGVNLHAGPYFAQGVGGKITSKYSDGSKDKQNTFGKETLKKFDFGLGFGAGVDFGPMNVGLGYDFGLTNISHEKLDNGKDAKLRNMNGYLTLGYKF